MRAVLLPMSDNPIAVNKYITSYHELNLYKTGLSRKKGKYKMQKKEKEE